MLKYCCTSHTFLNRQWKQRDGQILLLFFEDKLVAIDIFTKLIVQFSWQFNIFLPLLIRWINEFLAYIFIGKKPSHPRFYKRIPHKTKCCFQLTIWTWNPSLIFLSWYRKDLLLGVNFDFALYLISSWGSSNRR